MIAMLDTPQDLATCSAELGGIACEQLFTPLTRRAPQNESAMFAIDNGAFANFDARLFRNLLARHKGRQALCRFVAAPDVVGDARRTLEVFFGWKAELSGWPVALVVQNGQEHLPIPWDEIAAIFVGGDTEWKEGRHAMACVKAAIALGKWVHIGRVNTPGRYEYFEAMGADSFDGTGIARYRHMRAAINDEAKNPKLNFA